MANKIRELFCPTPEELEQQMKPFVAIFREQVSRKACCTCESYTRDDLYDPGFVTGGPICKHGGSATESCELYKTDDYVRELLSTYPIENEGGNDDAEN